jgi:O-antigen ligase
MHGLLIFVLIGVLGFLAFVSSVTDPAIVGAVLALILFGIFFIWLSLSYPVASLGIIILAQVLVPVYVRVPLPGMPALPPALFLVFGFTGVLMLKGILRPAILKYTKYEDALTKSVLIYCGILLVTIFFGHLVPSALSMWLKTAFVPLIFFLIFLRTIPDINALRLAYDMLAVAAVACGILAVHEYFTGSNVVATLIAPQVSAEEDFFLWYLMQNNKSIQPYRVYSFFTQPLEFSAFMIMILPYTILSFVTQTRTSVRLVYGTATAIIFAGFVVTFSRGPTLALLVTLLLLSVMEKPLRRWATITAIGFIAVLTLASPWIFTEGMLERIQGSKNVSLRFRLWENGLEIFKDNPIFGIGYGSYPTQHVGTIRDNQIGPMYEYPWQQIERVTTMENIYVTLAAETGLLGLSAFVLLIAVYFSIIRKVIRETPLGQARTLALASFGGVSAYLLSGLTVANIIGYTISILFFGVFLASAAVLSRGLKNPPRQHLSSVRAEYSKSKYNAL